MGIEPTPSAWEAEVLPLNYTRSMFRTSPCGPAIKEGPRLYRNDKKQSWQDVIPDAITMTRKPSFGNSEIFLVRSAFDRLFEPTRLFAMTRPGLFGVTGIAVLGFAGGFPPAPGILQNFFRLHAELAGFGQPLVPNGLDFIDLLVLDLVLRSLDQSLEFLDGRGLDDVFDGIAHSLVFAAVNVRCEMYVIRVTTSL